MYTLILPKLVWLILDIVGFDKEYYQKKNFWLTIFLLSNPGSFMSSPSSTLVQYWFFLFLRQGPPCVAHYGLEFTV
jgi:hypothetical protein